MGIGGGEGGEEKDRVDVSWRMREACRAAWPRLGTAAPSVPCEAGVRRAAAPGGPLHAGGRSLGGGRDQCGRRTGGC